MAEARGGEQGDQSEKSNQVNNNSTDRNSSSKFPYKVYEISREDKVAKGEQSQSEFAFREFDRLDVLLNLSLIHRKRALDISNYLIKIGKTTMETGMRMIQIHSGNKTHKQNYRNTAEIGRRLISAGKKIMARGKKVLKAVLHPSNEKPLRAHKANTPATRISEVVTPVIKMISLCSHGPSYYGVTLLGGFRAGHFVSHGRVDNMQACIKKCCANQECDLAFMVKEDCYSVICYHMSLCRSVRAQHIRKYKPRIAHIWRGSNDEKERENGHAKKGPMSRMHVKSTGKSSLALVNNKEEDRIAENDKFRATSRQHTKPTGNSKLASVNRQEQESVTRKATSFPMSHNRKTTKPRKHQMTEAHQHKDREPERPISTNVVESHISTNMSSSHSVTGKIFGVNRTLEENSQRENQERNSQRSINHPTTKADMTQLATPTKSNKEDSQVRQKSKSATNSTRHMHSLDLKEANSTVYKDANNPRLQNSNSACPHSATKHNVGLRHGLKTGKFSYIGELSDMRKCLDTCCHDPDCDIAFMLDQSCYTVNCMNESVCHSVSYHHHQYTTKAVFVVRRFNKPKSRISDIQRAPNLGKGEKITLSSKKSFTKSSSSIPTFAQATKITKNRSAPSVPQNSDIHNDSGMWEGEKIKINLTGAQSFSPEGKEGDFQGIRSNKSDKEQWQNETTKVHLLNLDSLKSQASSLRQTSNSMLKHSNKIISANDKVDTRNNVPKTDSKPRVSVTPHSNLTVEGRKIESNTESAVNHNVSLKVKVNLSGGNSLIQGERDYYKPVLLSNKSLNSYAHSNSEFIEEKNKHSGQAGPGMSGSAELKIENESDTSSSQYKAGSSQYESGSSQYETGLSYDLPYPESNEAVEDYTSQGSAESSSEDSVNTKSQNCFSYSYYNVTLRGGLQAGKFTFVGRFTSKKDCVSRCCVTAGCDVTFVVLDRCFLVDCYRDDLCDITEAKNVDKFKPVISYVNRTFIDALVAKSLANSNLTSTEKIDDDSHITHISNEKKELSYNVGKNKNTTTDGQHSTPFINHHDSVLSTNLHQLDCIYSAPFTNVSFRYGRQAGLFTNHGTAKNIHECSQWCCQSKHCDAAFMISEDCFFVRCHSNKSCGTFTVRGSKFNPRMVFVKRHRLQLENTTWNTSNDALANPLNSSAILSRATLYPMNKSSAYNRPLTSSAALSVPSTDKLQAHDTIRYNPNATKATVLSVNTSTARGTSEDETGPKAERHVLQEDPSNFVEVKTNGSEFWWQVYKPEDIHQRNSSFKVELPKISGDEIGHATIAANRSSPQMLPGNHSYNETEPGLCSDSEIVNGVTLKGGYYAGLFTRQDNVTNMRHCVSRCCSLSKCNVAFMVTNICYSVQCFSDEKCTTVKAHYASRYHPQVSFIYQRSMNASMGDVKDRVSNDGVITDQLRCVLDDISEAKYTVQEGSIQVHSTARDLGDCAKLCCQTSGCEVALLDNSTCYSLNCHGNLTCPTMSLSHDVQSPSRSLIVVKDLLQSEMQSEHVHTAACDFSNVLHEVVLRGGSQSGKFKYLTEVDDMDTCIRECCRHKVCDLALMLKDNCFLVSCYNEMLCDPIPSRPSDYHPQIAYKVKHGKRRHIGKDVSLVFILNLIKLPSLKV